MAHTPPGQTRERVFRYVRERLLAGDPPTVREVQEEFGFRAVQSARSHLEALVDEGRLVKEAAGRARSYRLPEGEDLGGALVPLVGSVQAGGLTAAIEEPDGHVAVTGHRSPHDIARLFALRVRGDSMTGAGILEDDVVIVRRQPQADAGDIVVALVGDEATVKRLRFGEGWLDDDAEDPSGETGKARSGKRRQSKHKPPHRHVILEPANPAYEPIVLAAGDLELLGKVIELRRSLDSSRFSERGRS